MISGKPVKSSIGADLEPGLAQSSPRCRRSRRARRRARPARARSRRSRACRRPTAARARTRTAPGCVGVGGRPLTSWRRSAMARAYRRPAEPATRRIGIATTRASSCARHGRTARSDARQQLERTADELEERAGAPATSASTRPRTSCDDAGRGRRRAGRGRRRRLRAASPRAPERAERRRGARAAAAAAARQLGRASTRRGCRGSRRSRPAASSRTASGSSACSSGRSASWTPPGRVAPGSSTAAWRMIGPVSTPSSTKWTVTPKTFTPYSSACSIARDAGEGRQQRRVDVDHRVGEAREERGVEQLPCSRRARPARRRAPPASPRSPRRAPRGRRSPPRANDARRDAAPRAPARAPGARAGRTRPRRPRASPAVHRVEQRLEVGARARGEHADALSGRSRRARRRRSFG